MADEQFDDIRLVDLDENKTHRLDPTDAMYYVYLKLSARPPRKWSRFFNSIRAQPRHESWRDAWVEDDYIVIHAPLAEVDDLHIQFLLEDVRTANEQYRAFLSEAGAQSQSIQDAMENERKQIESLKNKLSFEEQKPTSRRKKSS